MSHSVMEVKSIQIRVTFPSSFFSTVTVHLAEVSPALAVMVAVPSALAVMVPELFTEAIAVLELLQETVLPESEGRTVAVSV